MSSRRARNNKHQIRTSTSPTKQNHGAQTGKENVFDLTDDGYSTSRIQASLAQIARDNEPVHLYLVWYKAVLPGANHWAILVTPTRNLEKVKDSTGPVVRGMVYEVNIPILYGPRIPSCSRLTLFSGISSGRI